LLWLLGSIVGLWFGYTRGYIHIGGALLYDVALMAWVFGGAQFAKGALALKGKGGSKSWGEMAALLKARQEAERKAKETAGAK
jgi:hypothetical protein